MRRGSSLSRRAKTNQSSRSKSRNSGCVCTYAHVCVCVILGMQATHTHTHTHAHTHRQTDTHTDTQTHTHLLFPEVVGVRPPMQEHNRALAVLGAWCWASLQHSNLRCDVLCFLCHCAGLMIALGFWLSILGCCGVLFCSISAFFVGGVDRAQHRLWPRAGRE